MDHLYSGGAAQLVMDQVRRQAETQQKISDPVISTYQALIAYMAEFQAELDDEHEIGARLVNFGGDVRFHIEDVGYTAPTLITFFGVTESGDRVQLVQHLSQLSVLLLAMKKREAKPYRIGFRMD